MSALFGLQTHIGDFEVPEPGHGRAVITHAFEDGIGLRCVFVFETP
jgi:hypothetical protein